MDKTLFEKLSHPQGINELLDDDFEVRRGLDPKIIETYLQAKHRELIDAVADLSRVTLLLAKTQADRYREREKDRLRQREVCLLHTDVVVRANGFSWIANWRTGGYRKTKTGKVMARFHRIRTKKDGNYSLSSFRRAPGWARDLAEDVESNYALLRSMSQMQWQIREAIYASSKACSRFFDTQPGCFVSEDRSPILTSSEAQARFADRFEL